MIFEIAPSLPGESVALHRDMNAKLSLFLSGVLVATILAGFEVSAEEIANWTGCPIDLDAYDPNRLAVELTTVPPPRKLSHGAEIVLVSISDSESGRDSNTETIVVLDRPGKEVLLILTSANEANWRVQATSGTVVRAIIPVCQPEPRHSLSGIT